ncbi:hypothetical protein BRC21_00505 [Candidatus Saccharibacteria bacterium SW_7_54_9]|nr:MAG: hypothetical protein BRC21_00505 [Candidatus Saccharibacteria bacterium SW_7_54_9]
MERELAGVIHRDDFINPHIIRTGFAPTEHQLEKLDLDSLSGACIYPGQRHLEDPYSVAGQSSFERNVGLFMAVMIGIGAIMSPGVFAHPSEVAGSIGRPASGRPMA